MHRDYIKEEISIDCSQMDYVAEANVLRGYLHRYLCSMLSYLNSRVRASDGRFYFDANGAMHIERMCLRIDDEMMEINKAKDIVKLLSFAGAMYGASHISYEADFWYKNRGDEFKHWHINRSEFVSAQAFFSEALKNEDLAAIMTFKSVYINGDDKENPIFTSLRAGETHARWNDEVFTEDASVVAQAAAWADILFLPGVHFPLTTPQEQKKSIMNDVRELCSNYGVMALEEELDIYEDVYEVDLGGMSLNFSAEQMDDVFARLRRLVALGKAVNGSIIFEGDLQAQNDPFLLCRLKMDAAGDLVVTYAAL